MPKTVTDLTNSVLNRLNEALNSSVGALEYGSGNTAYQGTTATIRDYLTEAQDELYRKVLLLPGRGAALTTAGQYYYTLANLSAQMEMTRSTANLYADGSTLWGVRGVTFAGTALTYCGVEALQLRTNNFQNVATGTPVYWYRDAGQGVGIWPAPGTAAGITAWGYVTPPPFATSATAVWLPDNLSDGLEFYACAKVAEKAFDDPSVFGRLAHFTRDLDEYRAVNFVKIPATLAQDLSMPPPVAPTKK
jgi:hypothetical protein